MQQQLEPIQNTANAAAVAVAGASFVGWLPDIAAGVSILWLAIQIYESKTGKRIREAIWRYWRGKNVGD